MRNASFGSSYVKSGFFWCIMALFSLSILFVSNGTLSASVNPQISAGWNHTIALKSDETVWTWGNNDDGKLGNGTNTSSNTPIQVSGLSGTFAAIACGGWHSAVLKSDGTVWTWGYNDDGQLGNGGTTTSYIPV